MAKTLDWDKIDSENESMYKEYAPEGTYENVMIDKVELVRSSQKDTPGLQFTFKDSKDYSFPKFGCTHWLSFNNDSWRQHHFKELFIVLGLTEDQARKSVELCEDNDGEDKIVATYEQVFKKALAKSKGVSLAVFYANDEAKYTTCDFASEKVRMNRPEKPAAKKDDTPLEGAVELSEEEVTDVPF